jgi:Flp pilus assembly pilin Flp
MHSLYAELHRLFKEEDAPTMVEYGLLLLLIALAVAASALVLGNGISTLFDAAGTTFDGATIPTVP